MDRKRFQTSKYVAAFAITTIIFIIGILLGNYFGSLKLNTLTSLQENLRLDTLGTELSFDIITDQTCEYLKDPENSFTSTTELYDVGKKLTFMEAELGATDPRVQSLKEYYHLLELKNLLLSKKLKEKCGILFNAVLYFYAIDEICPDCEGQGLILTYIHRKYPVFNVYSFDINIDNPAIKTLRDIYGIEYSGQVPAIAYKGRIYKGFRSRKEVAEILFPGNETIIKQLS